MVEDSYGAETTTRTSLLGVCGLRYSQKKAENLELEVFGFLIMSDDMIGIAMCGG